MVAEELKEPLVVVDADDLVAEPACVLRGGGSIMASSSSEGGRVTREIGGSYQAISDDILGGRRKDVPFWWKWEQCRGRTSVSYVGLWI